MKSIRVRAPQAVAAAVLACLAMTACSSPVRVGEAATVGNERISTGELNDKIAEFQAALKKSNINESQLQIPSIPRAILLQLIAIRQFDGFAQRNGIAVTDGDVDKLISEQGGSQQLGMAALGKGVAPSMARSWVRGGVIYQKALERFGANLTDQASVQAAQIKLVQQLEAVPVKISPRYGAWDNQQGGMVDEARFGKPAPSPSAQTQQDPSQGGELQQDPSQQQDPTAGQ
ncbi:hypothetical protein Skr01_46500 [Sphaerisporangium krabiense]|uniref:Peptidyl-prolyl cis-trans isomerase SurA n=1 Tax=Sphaerisporangium krabiense TaxID=763782 RepID=A0A7W8Z4X0_9ACTN|nr:SurA N-terminal domain-containing protein [Sphaerisporangium krabiense]MBB5627300.1 peptidyl-prolyl cis-trans isomerase SurA [Sphaerisporangium krabiense]GII64565.1 hypothetical protein Skr01_46500 [Sphaerisporangium krabiense]